MCVVDDEGITVRVIHLLLEKQAQIREHSITSEAMAFRGVLSVILVFGNSLTCVCV